MLKTQLYLGMHQLASEISRADVSAIQMLFGGELRKLPDVRCLSAVATTTFKKNSLTGPVELSPYLGRRLLNSGLGCYYRTTILHRLSDQPFYLARSAFGLSVLALTASSLITAKHDKAEAKTAVKEYVEPR